MQDYYHFISRCIVYPDSEQTLSEDPFAILIDQKDRLGKVYLSRPSLEDRLSAPEHQIILGRGRSGKTTLFEKLPGIQPPEVLSVRLALGERPHLREAQTQAVESKHILSLSWVSAAIFDAYWQARLLNPSAWLNYYPRLRLDAGWRDEFRWFYQRFPPPSAVIYEQHELMAWLQLSSGANLSLATYSDASLLRRLVRLVLRPMREVNEVGAVQADSAVERAGGEVQKGAGASRQPYQRVYLWLDGVDHLTAEEISRLLDDLQMLYGLGIPGMRFKLFLDDSWEASVRQLEPVLQGAIALETIPAWSETDLIQMILLRLQAWNSSVPEDWPNLIPSTISDYSARRYLLKRISERAIAAYTNKAWKTKPDAPVHALRLARRILEDLAARYARLQDPLAQPLPIFTLSDLNSLVRFYPDGEEEE